MKDWQRQNPRNFFEAGEWPHGRPRPGTPPEVLYAAELANALRLWAWSRSTGLADGLQLLAEATGLGASSLRKVCDGQAWPNLTTVARLELRLGASLTGWPQVAARLSRGTTAIPAVDPRHRFPPNDNRARDPLR